MSTPTTDPLAVIAARSVTPRPDCKIWQGATDRGYGRISVLGVVYRVHRVVWEAANGPVPEGMELDHLCRIRACCNLDHLELVTHTENMRRAAIYRTQAPQRHPRRKREAVCAQGHSLDTFGYVAAQHDDYVICKQCRRERYAAKNSAASEDPGKAEDAAA